MRKYLKLTVAILIALLSLNLISIVIKLDVLPNRYLYMFIGFIFLLNAIGDLCLFVYRKFPKFISGFVYAILIALSIVGVSYGNKTLKFLEQGFGNNNLKITTYDVLVLKNSSSNNITSLDAKTLGYLTSDSQAEEALSKITNIIKPNLIGVEDLYELYNKLINQEVESIILDEVYIDILSEDYPNIDELTKTVYQFDIEKTIEKTYEKIEHLEPFNVYLSGSDSRSSKIYNKSRSDVNMIITVNPEKKTVLLTSIPRDYYVQVHGKTGIKDKLTHSGIYGIDVSRDTVEDLFNINIEYSIKVGFSAVVELVDAVGGIEVYSDKTFKSYHIPGWIVKEGNNHFTGAEALAYARERYAYASGDRHRIKNQQQVLEATMKKIVSDKSILLKYDTLLTSLNNFYITDIPKELVTMLVKEQIDSMTSWTFISQTVDGRGASLPTYTAPNSKRYVMIPYEADVTAATAKINEILSK